MNKYIICLGDGMSDYPIPELGDQTPLQKAYTPNMDFITKRGRAGLLATIPDGFPAGSDVANMSVLGYDPAIYYTGRAPIEAVSLGIEIPKGKIAFRCNFVYLENDIMKSFCAGHISTEESAVIIGELNDQFKGGAIEFFTGVSYRHIMIASEKYLDLECTPPHNITDRNMKEYLPKGKTSQELIEIMDKANQIIADLEVNKKRSNNKQVPANNIWPWGQGFAPSYKSFKEIFGLTGGIITAVDLLKGIGKLAGLKTPSVIGATGFLDTNYQGKVDAALKILEKHDFVYIHVEAPDEAGHIGDYQLKIRAIEDFDKKVVGPMLEYQKQNPDTKIMVLPDHPTPCSLKTHTRDPVPVAMYFEGIEEDKSQFYNEVEAKKGSIKFDSPKDLLNYFFTGK